MQPDKPGDDLSSSALPVEGRETLSLAFREHCPGKVYRFIQSLEEIGFSCHCMEFWGQSGQVEFEGAIVEAIEGDTIKVCGCWITPVEGEYSLTIAMPPWLSQI